MREYNYTTNTISHTIVTGEALTSEYVDYLAPSSHTMHTKITNERLCRMTLPHGLHFTQSEFLSKHVELDYHHYAVPACASPLAWQPPSESFVAQSNGTRYYVPGCTSDPDRDSDYTDDFAEFKNRVLAYSDYIFTRFENSRFPNALSDTRIPQKILNRFNRADSTYSEALRYVHANWTEMRGIGPERVSEILYSDFAHTGTPDGRDRVSLVVCPECTDAFWQFLPEEFNGTPSPYSLVVYCPLCYQQVTNPGCFDHHTIPVDAFYPPEIIEDLPTYTPFSREKHTHCTPGQAQLE